MSEIVKNAPTKEEKKIAHYSEAEAAAAGDFEPNGYRLIDRLLNH